MFKIKSQIKCILITLNVLTCLDKCFGLSIVRMSVSRRHAIENFCKCSIPSLLYSTVPTVSIAFDENAADIDQSFKKISTQTPTSDRKNAPYRDVPFRTLPSGVKIKDFVDGTGELEVKKGSRVWVQATGRLLNLNGGKFFSTKDNIKDPLSGPEPLILTIGNGSIIPGLEEGMLGMKKGSIRRIIVPESLGYKKDLKYQPIPTSRIDRNALNSVILNPRRDASLLWDIQVERIK